MAYSSNGYYVVSNDHIKNYVVATRQLPLRDNAAGELLARFAREFNRTVEPISEGNDDWGYAYRKVTGGSYYSNHASGTAMDLNSVQHPYGKKNTFSLWQRVKIRALLLKYRNAIRWGGDYKYTKDEMHFEINKPLEQVNRILTRLKRRD